MLIAFCAHPEQPAALAEQEACLAWLAGHGIGTRVFETHSLRFGSPELAQARANAQDVTLVVALGGDGTMLRAARLAAGVGLPLLGVNFGHLGYLTGATSGSTIRALKAFLAGKLHEDARVMLTAELTLTSGVTVSYDALNEIIVSRSDAGRVISIDISVNGHPLPTPRGDGIIIATATGSTAYALSAGGPLLTPSNQGLTIVPICAHGFNAAALVAAPTDVITLRPRKHAHQRALVCIDGQTLELPGEVQLSSVVVRKAARDLVLLRYDSPDFFTRIGHSLVGGNGAL